MRSRGCCRLRGVSLLARKKGVLGINARTQHGQQVPPERGRVPVEGVRATRHEGEHLGLDLRTPGVNELCANAVHGRLRAGHGYSLVSRP